MLSVLRADGAKLRLEGVGREVPHIIGEDNFLHVQLVLDDLHIVVVEPVRRLDIHAGERLAVLDVARVAAGSAHDDGL